MSSNRKRTILRQEKRAYTMDTRFKSVKSDLDMDNYENVYRQERKHNFLDRG